jgi:hypothetical protein
MYDSAGFLLVLLLWLGSIALSLWILYAIIRAAVRNALIDRYKIVRWYELTGEWAARMPASGAALGAVGAAGFHGEHRRSHPGVEVGAGAGLPLLPLPNSCTMLH